MYLNSWWINSNELLDDKAAEVSMAEWIGEFKIVKAGSIVGDSLLLLWFPWYWGVS